MGGLLHRLRYPRRCYVVCAIPRSGSNLLTDGLRSTRRAGAPKQFFLQKFEAAYGARHGLDPAADYAAYVRGIVNGATTRNEVFGFKLMSWYLDELLKRLRETGAFGPAAARSRAAAQCLPTPAICADPAPQQIATGIIHGPGTSDRSLESAKGQNHSAGAAIRRRPDRAISSRGATTGKNLGRFFPAQQRETLPGGIRKAMRGLRRHPPLGLEVS